MRIGRKVLGQPVAGSFERYKAELERKRAKVAAQQASLQPEPEAHDADQSDGFSIRFPGLLKNKSIPRLYSKYKDIEYKFTTKKLIDYDVGKIKKLTEKINDDYSYDIGYLKEPKKDYIINDPLSTRKMSEKFESIINPDMGKIKSSLEGLIISDDKSSREFAKQYMPEYDADHTKSILLGIGLGAGILATSSLSYAYKQYGVNKQIK